MSDELLDVPATHSELEADNEVTDGTAFARSNGGTEVEDSFDVWNRLCHQYGLDQFQLYSQPESNRVVAPSAVAGQNLYPHIQSDALFEMQSMRYEIQISCHKWLSLTC